ncbi:mediator of RNA polymerase II transcription subunit 13-like isoform X2 [Lytechinus variegatus]|uniref:mediator of RNA polymerase II transcription subunit 13-like isoform X2 n=1 Tax=Lytechinus variegatus TaxID=7654 RepID=UPI001BB1DA44|nr:mediator of RNA polymerase II transcription subunit 13-like isoform X2 [Lytechinus variegatus]
MSGANSAANGASLEDCYTNLFAVADLSGIKWRQYSWTCPTEPKAPLEDPVLRSYANCIKENILSVWRCHNTLRADLMLDTETPEQNKELWIYWYGDDPKFESLIVDELQGGIQAQGVWDNCMSYECRTLLFKSFHNSIERCLLSGGYVRLGRWFVKPFTNYPIPGENLSDHHSVSFSFFLHGEKTVCSNVEVGLHQPVCRLTADHLAIAQGSATAVPVILSPYGLSGFLTGQAYKATHQVAQRILFEWQCFYPIKLQKTPKGERDRHHHHHHHHHHQHHHTQHHPHHYHPGYREEEEDNTIPAVVEVHVGSYLTDGYLTGGIRMLYPSCYVLVPQSEFSHHHAMAVQAGGYIPPPSMGLGHGKINGPATPGLSSVALTPPTSPPDQQLPPGDGSGALYTGGSTLDPSLGDDGDDSCTGALIHKVTSKVWSQWLTETVLPTPGSGGAGGTLPNGSMASTPGTITNTSGGVGGGAGSMSQQSSLEPCSISAEDNNSNLETKPSLVPPPQPSPTANQFTWQFQDPSSKTDCACSRQKVLKLKSRSKSPSSTGSAHSGHSGIGNPAFSGNVHRQQRSQRPSTPFHHRATHTDDLIGVDQELSSRLAPIGVPTTPSSSVGPVSQESKPSNNALPKPSPAAFRTPGSTDPVLTESPPSVAPSPLIPPPTGTGLNPSERDRTMPTLSPYPPPRNGETGLPQANSGPVGSSIGRNCDMGHSIERDALIGRTIGHKETTIKQEEDKVWQNFRLPSEHHMDSKRPLLPLLSYEKREEENENMFDSLYDPANNDEIFCQPHKKLKEEKPVQPAASALDFPGEMDIGMRHNRPPSPVEDPYEFMEHDTSPTQGGRISISARGRMKVNGRTRGGPRRPSIKKSKIKEEEIQRRAEEEKPRPETLAADGQSNVFNTDPSKAMASAANKTMAIKGETKRLMHTDDIKVTGMGDLERLFESSSSDDDDGGFDDMVSQVIHRGEESSTKPFGNSLHSSTGMPGTSQTGPDLARMYPTPPSLEQQNSAFSPVNLPCHEYINHGSVQGITQIEHSAAGDFNEIEADENMGSPKPEQIQDWSFVYKIPPTERFVGPSMYAPLKALPSSKQPPLKIPEACHYRPSWQLPLSPKPDLLPVTKDSLTLEMEMNMNQPIVFNAPGPTLMQSPAAYPGSQEPRSAANIDLQSPASEASSYVRNINSMEAPTPASNIPEAHSLLVNLTLSDSLLNIYKDRNFDSSVMCVCNKNHMCQCGFSAVMNRRYAVGSGLFAEDESEITGQPADAALWTFHKDNPMLAGMPDRKPLLSVEDASSEKDGKEVSRTAKCVLRLIQEQCNSPYATLARLAGCVHKRGINSSGPLARSQIEITDGCDACFAALDLGRILMDGTAGSKIDDALLKSSCLHSWPYTPALARSTMSSQDVVRTLSSLQPLLQDAIQKKRTTRLWEKPYTVQGPLTWQVFFNIGARGPAETPEPLPIPRLMIGHDKDWLSSSPFALYYWEKLMLEPYSSARDVAYIALVPENKYILRCATMFFKELTAVYEGCRLGRHAPIAKTFQDGIMKIGKKYAQKLSNEPVDVWFSDVTHLPEADKLKLYAQFCRAYVAPFLNQEQPDASMFRTSRHHSSSSAGPNLPGSGSSGPGYSSSSSYVVGSSSSSGSQGGSLLEQGSQGSDASSASMPAPSSTPSRPANRQDSKDSGVASSDNKENIPKGTALETVTPRESEQPPAVVVYIVDPFRRGEDAEEEGEVSVATLGLMHCFAEIFDKLQVSLQRNIAFQIIPLHQVLQVANSEVSSRFLNQLKSVAFSVFAQCRRFQSPTIPGRSLTGFGPAADLDRMIISKNVEHNEDRLYAPPFILAPIKDKQTELGESFGGLRQACGELFCSYCLSHDQRWLLVSCTDSKGELMETQIINVDVQNSKRRNKVSIRNIALYCLWDFLMGVMSKASIPWRLVIGRLGRLGQGELKDWSMLLSRKNLANYSRKLREQCSMCSVPGTCDFPCILSACLVSTEPEPALRIMADMVAADKCSKNSQRDQPSCQLHTPDDASCTHIMVFPTSATKQAAATNMPQDQADLTFNSDIRLDDEDNIFDEEMLLNIFMNPSTMMPDDPTNIQLDLDQEVIPDGPAPAAAGPGNPTTRQQPNTESGIPAEPEEVLRGILQQPLALGYFVSTAKTGPLPKWFWSACPEAENSCPVFLKAALHVHNPSEQPTDDILQTKHSHPLDSDKTPEVLRYVLETYNSLSWLTVDPASGDRRSCLPVHMVVLVQLYNTIASLQ